jgi:hypothetical protein
MRSLVLSSLLAVLMAGSAAAQTEQDLCEAHRLTASGKRILAKLKCRAKAKLKGNPVSAACLDRAEKLYLVQLAKAGNACAAPDDLVVLGAESDKRMSNVVEAVVAEPGTIPDLSGTWQTRTILRVAPGASFSLECQYYPPGQCPVGDLLSITDCTTTVVQSGSTLAQSSQCTTPPESPVQLGSFEQAGVGTVNPVTGEWTLDGSVFVPGFSTFFFSGEGVYAPDGQSMTGVTTAGFAAGQSLWLATTTGQKVS